MTKKITILWKILNSSNGDFTFEYLIRLDFNLLIDPIESTALKAHKLKIDENLI